MLARTLERVIKNAKQQQLPDDGIAEKIDVFYAAGKLTKDEYEKLTAMLEP